MGGCEVTRSENRHPNRPRNFGFLHLPRFLALFQFPTEYLLASTNVSSLPHISTSSSPKIENAPTCYRAPKWPDPEFPRKIPKKYPPARNSGLPKFTPKIPRKYRKNTPKYQILKCAFLGIFSVFFWYIFLGSRISGRGVFFRYFSWKFRVGPSRGSVAGRGVLNPKTRSGHPKLTGPSGTKNAAATQDIPRGPCETS